MPWSPPSSRPRRRSRRPRRLRPTSKPDQRTRDWPRRGASLEVLASELAGYVLQPEQVVAVVLQRDLQVAVDADLAVALVRAGVRALLFAESPNKIEQTPAGLC